ncbi:ABC transporter permease, partial [bacterium]|nr:ABC transporter permease [bacterium]
MSATRFFEIFRQEINRTVKSPAFIIFLLVLFFVSWGLTTGGVSIQSGSSDVGGTKLFITSEFSIACIISILSFILYSFFVTIPAGMTLIRDRECKVEEIIHTTALTPQEYIAGKYLAVVAIFFSALLFQAGMFMFFHHVVPNINIIDSVGPFSVLNYLNPFLIFSLPTIMFFTGIAFFLGEWTRRPAVVYLFPAIILILDIFFLIDWSPAWLSETSSNILMILEPSGFRWLQETWLNVDMGAEFYNTRSIPFDKIFLLNRLFTLSLGILPVWLAYGHFKRKLRSTESVEKSSKSQQNTKIVSVQTTGVSSIISPKTLNSIQTTRSIPGFFSSLLNIMHSEFQELRNHAGLYLFIPLFMLFVFGDTYTAIGIFDSPMLVTPGGIAVQSLGSLTLLGSLFLMFYVVESFKREEITGIAPILHSSPVSGYAIIIGKILAILLVGIMIICASFIMSMVALLFQGTVPANPFPMFLIWGLILIPTYFVWITFITLLYSAFQNRYLTYSAGLGLLVIVGTRQKLGKMNWVGNWN